MKVVISGFFGGIIRKENDVNKYDRESKFQDKLIEFESNDITEIFIGHISVALIKNNFLYFTDLAALYDPNYSDLVSEKCLSGRICSDSTINQIIIPITTISDPKFIFNHKVRMTFDDQIILFNNFGIYIIDPNETELKRLKKYYDNCVLDVWYFDEIIYFINEKKQLCAVDLKNNEYFITSDGDIVSNCIKLVGGYEHICVLTADGKLYTYGCGTKGQIGCGYVDSFTQQAYLLDCLGVVRIKDVVSGGWHILALSETNDLYSWGWNESLQIGIKEKSVVPSPTLVNIPPNDSNEYIDIQKISAGSRHSAIIDTDGHIWGWGNNQDFQITCQPINDTLPLSLTQLNSNIQSKDIKSGRWCTVITYQT